MDYRSIIERKNSCLTCRREFTPPAKDPKALFCKQCRIGHHQGTIRRSPIHKLFQGRW